MRHAGYMRVKESLLRPRRGFGEIQRSETIQPEMIKGMSANVDRFGSQSADRWRQTVGGGDESGDD